MGVKQCPDGSYVSRDGNNGCAFSACPTTLTTTVGCGIDRCTSYNDGCNECTCNVNGNAVCTERACLVESEPFCTGCSPGFIIDPSTNKCEGCMCPMMFDPVCCDGTKTYSNGCVAGCQQAQNCVQGACRDPDVQVASLSEKCGGFDNCVSYYDGCNNCVCGSNGMAACTRMMCFRKGTPKCIKCAKGFSLDGYDCV